MLLICKHHKVRSIWSSDDLHCSVLSSQNSLLRCANAVSSSLYLIPLSLHSRLLIVICFVHKNCQSHIFICYQHFIIYRNVRSVFVAFHIASMSGIGVAVNCQIKTHHQPMLMLLCFFLFCYPSLPPQLVRYIPHCSNKSIAASSPNPWIALDE